MHKSGTEVWQLWPLHHWQSSSHQLTTSQILEHLSFIETKCNALRSQSSIETREKLNWQRWLLGAKTIFSQDTVISWCWQTLNYPNIIKTSATQSDENFSKKFIMFNIFLLNIVQNTGLLIIDITLLCDVQQQNVCITNVRCHWEKYSWFLHSFSNSPWVVLSVGMFTRWGWRVMERRYDF